MLGLTRTQARERFDDIIAFAELEEFLDLKLKNYSSGMTRAAGVLGRDPGRRRRAAGRRGARRRRRRVPAEVLRAVPAAQARGQDDHPRHARHGARSSASATARCCSSAARCCRSASRTRSRAPTTSSTSAGSCTTSVEGDALRRPRARPRSSTAWFETPAASGSRRSRRASRCELAIEVALPRADSTDPIFAFALRNEIGPHGVRDLDAAARARDRAASRAGDDGDRPRRRSSNWLRAEPATSSRRRSRAPGGGADALDMREDLASLMRARHAAPPAGSLDVRAHASRWSAA